MRLDIEAIHHVGLVVKDREVAEGFYVDVLGLERVPGRPAWFKLNATHAIHLIPLGTGEPEHAHHRYRHVALRVADLRVVLDRLLGNGIRGFQADFEGNEKVVVASDDPLDFGTGSLFALDPDGNTIEFVQLGRGIFAEESGVAER
jgi:catechol 2,3-dioxygenase-like lactoylglutathione lyase family enzyme